MEGRKKSRIQVRNEEKILTSARSVFAAYGYNGATLEKIAQLADMSQPNLHHYFKTKTDLYAAVLEAVVTPWVNSLEMIDRDGRPEDELRRYIRAKLELSRVQPDASRLFAHEIISGAPMLGTRTITTIKAAVDQFAAVITHWIEVGELRSVDPTYLLFLIWSSTQHYADFNAQVVLLLGKTRLTKSDYDNIGETISTIVLKGIVPDY